MFVEVVKKLNKLLRQFERWSHVRKDYEELFNV